MKKNFKKALAFALATVTVAANLGVATPVTAAEYEEAKNILPTEYEMYGTLGDNAYFTNSAETKNADGTTANYVSEIVIVDKNGEKSTMEVKNADGTYKYKYVSPVSDDCVAMVAPDDTYALYFADGTWFGNGTEKYEDIFVLNDGNFIVSDDKVCNLVDKTGKVMVKDVFTPGAYEGIYWWLYCTFGDYIVLGRETYVGATSVNELKLFDKNYKSIDTVDSKDVRARVVEDYLVVYSDKAVSIYDKNLKKLGFTFELDVVENPSATTDGGYVLTDYRIAGAYKDYNFETEKDLIVLYCEEYYENALGETNSWYTNYYFDYETLKEIAESDITFTPLEPEPESIYSTDVEYIFNAERGIFDFTQGGKTLFTIEDVYQCIASKKSLDTDVSYSWRVAGASGNVFISISTTDDQDNELCYTIMLTKESGYALDKGTIYDKWIYSSKAYSHGLIMFDDDTSYFDGKMYDTSSAVELIITWDRVALKSVAKAYTIKEGKEDAYTWTLYDADGVVITKTSERVIDYTDSGHAVTMKIVESEDGSYGDVYFGCIYVKKVLVSSEDVIAELGKVEEGATVEVEIKKNDPIKADVFEAIKGKDVNVVIKTPSGITWTINGKDVTGTSLKDIDLTVDIVKDVVPAAAISEVKLDGEKIELSLAHTGDFGFTAELKINVKAENTGKFANLFYFNPTTKKLEFQETVKIDANGDAAFKYTHASDYVIILSDAAYDATTPQTADATNIGMLIALLAVAAGAVVFVQKKRVAAK